MTTNKLKGIIFDLDGTMVDNMMVHHRAWQETLRLHGLNKTLEEVMEQIHGINEEIIHRLFGDRFSAEEIKKIADQKEETYRSIFKPQLKLVAGLQDLIKDCKRNKISLGIATAAPKENMDFVLDNLNIREYFDATIHAGQVTKGKPNPEVFLKAANKLNVSPSDCLIFEDSITGVQAANNAGIKVIVVLTTLKEVDFKDMEVLRFIKDFTEIESLTHY